MNMNLDDPKLTAYALDELSGTEKAEMEAAVAASPEAREFVRKLHLLSGDLRAEYTAERESHSILQTTVVPLEQKDEPWSISRRLALAAALALFAVIGVVAIGTLKRGGLAPWGNGARYAGGLETKDIEEFGRGVVEGIESPCLLPIRSWLRHRQPRRALSPGETPRHNRGRAGRLVVPSSSPLPAAKAAHFRAVQARSATSLGAVSRHRISTPRATALSRKTPFSR